MQRLVYNQVWEDYEVDRVALEVGADDVVLMITSGGCNVLNTVIEGPRRIVTLDLNVEQRALLEDKIRTIRRGDYGHLWQTYGVPAQRDSRSVYGLGAYARFAWIRRCIHLLSGRDTIRRFVAAPSMEEQREIYARDIEPRLFTPAVRALPAAVAGVCGMHWRQIASTLRYGRFRLQSICQDRLRHVMTSFPIRENYYWHQMLTGEYAGPTHCPPYLQPNNFTLLRSLVDRVDNRHQDVIAYLRSVPSATFTRANLLDLPEFVSPARRTELFREVRRVCAPGARIVFRTFAPGVFVPTECNGDTPGGLRFERERSQRLTMAERTASYGSVHLYTM